jgi:hypothetical protein
VVDRAARRRGSQAPAVARSRGVARCRSDLGEERLGVQRRQHGAAQHTLGAFLVRDVESTVADLRGKGVSFEDYDLPGVKTVNGIAELGGIRGAWFKDPEGNILSVVQLPAT